MSGHDRLMTVDASQVGEQCLRLLHASRSTASTGSRSTGAASNRACGLPEVFHVSPRSRSIARELRVRRSSPVVRAICQRSIGSVSTASKRRHMAWCCVCMQVNETGHAQRLNMLKPSREMLVISRQNGLRLLSSRLSGYRQEKSTATR